MIDLYNAVQHSLRHNVPLRSNLTVHEMRVLKEFLDLLVQFFPFQKESHKDDIERLSDWLNHRISENSEIGITIYDQALKLYNALPAEQEYVKCKGSSSEFRGYPCALWSLFHTLTVAEFKLLLNTQGKHKVLFVMRDFIRTFFTCANCADEFWKMSAELIENNNSLTIPRSSVLWLWRAHNKVNKRLQCDLTEDPQYPKMEYPKQSYCATCLDEKSQWIESNVFRHLLAYYSAENIEKNENSATSERLHSSSVIFIFIVLLSFV
ncbi:sulfhydryl oxidase 1-like isoform X2 [Leptotrombidium deliense]|uniref:Sulfhydryl oxidase n=1 Tax=Leptotrombidium deliense TaxID=299467 RepID=A0A443S624_9ACAR|nr:sulfhydryl oxidase 1-like isoform X2 [Leptotrombidium deliense]